MNLDINIDSQIVVKSAAQWASDTDVYSEKRILVTSDELYSGTTVRKIKIPNGVNQWSDLDYLPAGAATVAWNDITGKPTTIAGFGITDAYTKTEVDAIESDLDDLIDTETAARIAGDASTLFSANNYTDSAISSATVGLLDDRGNFNASGNVYPSSGGSGTAGIILKGDLWTISVSGTLGGVAVTAGDVVRALIDSPGQTASNWAIGENNFGYVAENSANKTGTVTGNETSTQLYLHVKGYYDYLVAMAWLTAARFGSWMSSMTSKTTPVDADNIVIGDSAASGDAKKVSLINLWTNYFKVKADALYQALSSNLTSWSAITRASGFDTFTTTPTSANLAALLTDETGTGSNVFANSPAFSGTPTTPTATVGTNTTQVASTEFVVNSRPIGRWYSDSTAVSPADGSVYYFGTINNNAPETVNTYRMKSPRANAVFHVTFCAIVRTSVGSAQSTTIRIQNITAGTSEVLTTAFMTTDRINSVSLVSTLASALNDEMTIEITNPAWVTNPVGVQYQWIIAAY